MQLPRHDKIKKAYSLIHVRHNNRLHHLTTPHHRDEIHDYHNLLPRHSALCRPVTLCASPAPRFSLRQGRRLGGSWKGGYRDCCSFPTFAPLSASAPTGIATNGGKKAYVPSR